MANITFAEIISKAKARHKEFIAKMDDKTALMYPRLFPEWKTGEEYTAGTRVRVGDVLYRVLEDHVAEEGLEPDICDKYEKVEA